MKQILAWARMRSGRRRNTGAIHFDDPGQTSLSHLVKKACLGARITELASTVNCSGVLVIELASQMLGARLQGHDALGAKGRLCLRTRRVVRHDQAMAFPLCFGDRLAMVFGGRRRNTPARESNPN
jgi:hypothetical protein